MTILKRGLLMKKCLLFILFSITFNSLASAGKNIVSISKAGDIDHNITEAFLDTAILQDYWSGDDGVSCGEPHVHIYKIDDEAQEISFRVSLSGQKAECHEKHFACVIDFYDSGNSIEIVDEPIYCGYEQKLSSL